MVDLLFARRLSERLWNLQRQGRLTTVAPLAGQEAAVVGVVRGLDLATDWLVPYYRDATGYGALGDEFVEQLVVYWRGHPDGGRIPDGVRALPVQISLATQVPHAAGLAWGLALRGEPGVVCTFVGDGATSEGDFYEAINLAGVQRAPLIVVCINNGWAISTPADHQTAAETFAAKGAAAGIPGVRVDGNDVRRGPRGDARGAPPGRSRRRTDAARARHLPDGRAHQLRRPHPLRPRRRARGVAGARSRSSGSRASCAAPGCGTSVVRSPRSRRSRSGSNASSNARSAREVDPASALDHVVVEPSARSRAQRAEIAARSGSGPPSEPEPERATRATPTTTPTPGSCRGEHDDARGDPRDAARRDGARRAHRAPRRGRREERRRVPSHRRRARALRRPTGVRHADLGVDHRRRVGRVVDRGARAGRRDPVRRLHHAGVPPARRAARPLPVPQPGPATSVRSPCAPRTAAASAPRNTTAIRWRRRTRTPRA